MVGQCLWPSLKEKGRTDRWPCGSSTKQPYILLRAFTVHLMGQSSWQEKARVLRETIWVWTWLPVLYLSTQSWTSLLLLFHTTISLLLAGLFPYWVSLGLLLSQPDLSTGSCLQSTYLWVSSCPLLDYWYLIYFSEFVWLQGIWQFQWKFCLAPCLGMPCGGGIFDNHSCKEPLGVYEVQLLLLQF